MIIYEEIFRAFQKLKVKYVLVGGIAVNLLGCMRNTADLDVLVEMSDANLKKIMGILKNLDYHVKQPIDPMKILDKKTREDLIEKKHMKALNFYKERELKEIDIIIESPIPYKDAKKDVIYIKVDDLRLPVISIDNLIRMKQKTGRAVDKLDIAELTKIKKFKKDL